MKKALMIVAIVALVAIAGSTIYYFVFFKPEVAKAEIRLQVQKLQFEQEKQKATELSIQTEESNKQQQELNNAQQEANKEQQELNKEADLRERLANLEKWRSEKLQEAYNNHTKFWNAECERLGLKSGSALPKDTAIRVDEQYQKDIEYINKLYQDLKDDIYKLHE